MFPTRILRAVAQSSKFLEPGAPTGLTGLLTHPSPRPALISLYNSTLAAVGQMPESSVYRQSTEALTRHRLAIVEKAKPEGLAEWQTRLRASLDRHVHADKEGAARDKAIDDLVNDSAELARLGQDLAALEPEPPLSTAQIEEIEREIGAGLIEEVIQVAQGEKIVAETMVKNKVWEELEEKAAPGQWTYHARGTHTGTT